MQYVQQTPVSLSEPSQHLKIVLQTLQIGISQPITFGKSLLAKTLLINY